MVRMDKDTRTSVFALLSADTPPVSKEPISRYALRSGGSYKYEASQKKSSVHLTSDNDSPLSTTQKVSVTNDAILEKTMNTTALLLDEETITYATDSIYQEFLNLYKNCLGEHEVFELLKGYENMCTEKVNLLHEINIRQGGTARNKFYETLHIRRLLQEERNSWRLIRTLYQDRLETEASDEDCLMDTLDKHISDKQLIESLYRRDSTVRQYQLVVDWLEKNADERHEIYSERMEYFSDSPVAWENTLHMLQSHNKGIDLSWNNLLVNEIDPDCPIRQKDCSLHEADKEDEIRLVKYMFAYLRVGRLNQAQQVAERFGHPWLAAALEGWRLFHDANYTAEQDEDLNPVEGNCYRDIWKKVCWRASEEVKLPVHERAMYSALSGNLKGLLPACENWEDHLWAYFRVAVDVRIEQELRNSMRQERPFEDLPAVYWDKILTAEQIFQELQASPSEAVHNGAMTHHHIIQKFLILDDIDGLIEELFSWLHGSTRPPCHLVRFMAHLILFLRVIGRSSKEELCTAILESYVKDLIDDHRVSLVASYTTTLPPVQQVMWYAKFLEGITEQSERQKCLQYAEEADLDVPLITKTVVENIRSVDVGTVDPGTVFSSETTKEDKRKIEAVEWLVFDPLQRAEAIRQANALMRVFVASRKLDAAREVFAKIPSNSINIIIKEWKKLTKSTELSANDDNTIREYLCFQAYLQAHDAFNDWFEHYHHAKPEKPAPPSGESRFTDRVAYEHRLRQYEGDLERWQQSLKAQTKSTTERLYNVLLFVNGGWMVDQRTEVTTDEKRQQQMLCLRELCIPQVCFLLHNILHVTGQYKECLQLANIIASERELLYKTFSVQDLRNLFAKLRESSLALLDENLDPLGYPLQ